MTIEFNRLCTKPLPTEGIDIPPCLTSSSHTLRHWVRNKFCKKFAPPDITVCPKTPTFAPSISIFEILVAGMLSCNSFINNHRRQKPQILPTCCCSVITGIYPVIKDRLFCVRVTLTQNPYPQQSSSKTLVIRTFKFQ